MPPYRDFTYPLNVFVHLILHEEGRVGDLHYGLFENGETSLVQAQRRSTELLLDRLPPPPARLLEVGFGLGGTLARLCSLGYSALGIGPDPAQLELARERHGSDLPVLCSSLEELDPACGPFEVILFQESAQYIPPETLFAQVIALSAAGARVLVLDELRLVATPDGAGGLPERSRFLKAAERHGLEKLEELDLSTAAAPTVSWFLERLPAWRDRLVDELGLAPAQVDELIESGGRYRDHYRDGVYGYRLLVFERPRTV